MQELKKSRLGVQPARNVGMDYLSVHVEVRNEEVARKKFRMVITVVLA
jgi:hypothetical protein